MKVSRWAASLRTAGARSSNAVATRCSALGIIVAYFTMVSSTNWRFNPTYYIHMEANEPMASLARQIDKGFNFVPPGSHYDGVYYYAIALDPFARGKPHTLIDFAPYRYGHPLQGWLAALLSLGHHAMVPLALALLSLIGVGLGCFFLSKVAAKFGLSPWWGLAFAAQPGILFATMNSTTEPVGLALVLIILFVFMQPRPNLWLLGPLSVMLCLDKEPYVFVVLALAVWELWQARDAQARRRSRLFRAGLLCLGIPVLGLWYIYVHSVFHQFPNHYGSAVFGVPFEGWHQAFRFSDQLLSGNFLESQLGSLVAPMLVAYLVLYGAALIKILRMRNVVQLVALPQIAISLCTGYVNLVYPHEILRDQVVSLFLAAFVLAIPSRLTDARDNVGDNATEVPFYMRANGGRGLIRQ